MHRYPYSFIALGSLGLLGFGALLHPVLDDPMAGLAFIVSAVALFGSAAFPLVIEKLKENEGG